MFWRNLSNLPLLPPSPLCFLRYQSWLQTPCEFAFSSSSSSSFSVRYLFLPSSDITALLESRRSRQAEVTVSFGCESLFCFLVMYNTQLSSTPEGQGGPSYWGILITGSVIPLTKGGLEGPDARYYTTRRIQNIGLGETKTMINRKKGAPLQPAP